MKIVLQRKSSVIGNDNTCFSWNMFVTFAYTVCMVKARVITQLLGSVDITAHCELVLFSITHKSLWVVLAIDVFFNCAVLFFFFFV